MEEEIKEAGEGKNSTKIWIVSGVCVITVLFVFLILLTLTVGYGKIYEGVSVNGIEIGGLTTEQAEAILKENYKSLSSREIKIEYEDYNNSFLAKEINASLDFKEAAKLGYICGREGNVFKKIYNGMKSRLSKQNIEYNVSVDRKKIDTQINNLTKNIETAVIQPSYVREGDKLVIKTGITGISVDHENLRLKIIEELNKMKNVDVEIDVEKIFPDEVNIEKIQNAIKKDVKDAEYKSDTGILIEQVIGIEIENLEEAKKIAKSVNDEGMQFSIPLKITLPENTTDSVLKELFKDELSTYTTYFNVNEVERTQNVKLAAGAIDETILMPGQEFSYNTVVGERTTENGFKIAKVYQQGQIVDGLGGGICQVSSTLYNAAVKADLEILERKNHSLPVAYVKLGRDATVSYGLTDFRLKNSLQYPIKIESETSGGTLTIRILGINNNKSRTVDIRTETVAVLQYAEKEIEEELMLVGESQLIQAGKKGYKVKSYRVTKENGVVVEEKLISTDTYSPVAQIKKIGTKADV